MGEQTRFSHPIYGLLPTEVEGFDSLAELALDMRWSWNHATDEVWRRLDPKLWEITHNPWVVLQTVSRDQIERVMADPVFRKNVDGLVQTRRQDMEAPAWFQQNHSQDALTCAAYFSMEFMLSEALPIYSGGLGNVAGDQLKATSELYGGGPELRLKQELLLGIGGWRLLGALGVKPEVCHLNEGHAGFAVLERARSFMEDTEQPFKVALAATRAGNLFTTHTAVAAGFDCFAPALIEQYLGGYAEQQLGIPLHDLLALGRRTRDQRSPHADLGLGPGR